jgi:signal peptidase I
MTQDSDKQPEGAIPEVTGSSGEPPAPGEAHGPSDVQTPGPKKPSQKSAAREWLETIIIALLVALLIRGFVVQVYMVEGESMEPSLHTAERLLVNKFLYRFRPPQPGEIVVLQDPGQPTRELIKRVVAVAGETVEVRRSVVYVNGKALNEPYKNTEFTQYADSPPVQVPAGNIFVMGDNRGRSFDSRMIGPIPLNKVDGKAFFMFWPMDRFAKGPLDRGRVYEQAGTSK